MSVAVNSKLTLTGVPDGSVINAADYGVIAGVPTYDNGPVVQALLDSARDKGISIELPMGDIYFQTGFTLYRDNVIYGKGTRATRLLTTSAFTLITDRRDLPFVPCGNFRLIGFDDSNPNSIAIKLYTTNFVGTGMIGPSTIFEGVYLGDGWYDGINSSVETDLLVIKHLFSVSNFGRAGIWHETLVGASAGTACPIFEDIHFAGQNVKVVGKNFYGIHVGGGELPTFRNCVITGFDRCIDIESYTGVVSNFSANITGLHTEEFRPFIYDPLPRANSTAYGVGKEVNYGYWVFTCKTAGTSAASPPTFNNTYGATTVDGTVTWTCVGRHSARWTTGRAVEVGALVKPNKGSGFAAVYECTVAGTTGATEPGWLASGIEYGANISDGTATWTLRHHSTAIRAVSPLSGYRTVVTTNGHGQMGHLMAYSMGGNTSLDVVGATNIGNGNGDNDITLFVESVKAGSKIRARFANSHLIGDILRCQNAPTNPSTDVTQVVLDYARFSGDTTGILPTDGHGTYSAYDNPNLNYGGNATVNLDTTGLITCSNAATLTLPTPTIAQAGKRYVIQARTSAGVTVVFPSAMSYMGYTATNIYLPRFGCAIEFYVTSTGIFEILRVYPNIKALLTEVQTPGTAGGTFTAGTWTTRSLNTETSDVGGIVTLSSNQFTLLPGNYMIKARAPANSVTGHRIRLYDLTANANRATGRSAYAASGNQTDAELSCFVSIAVNTTYRIDHYCNTTKTTDGLGLAVNIPGASERYAEVEIERLF